MAEDIATLGFAVDSSQLKKGEADLNRFVTTAQKTGTQVQRSTTQMNKSFATTARSATDLSRAGRRFDVRQVSMQLSQVAQSASATGRPLQALAIQLPDIGLAFGTIGIAAGVAAGALLPLIGNLIGAGDEAKDAEDAMDAFLGSLKNYERFADTATSSTSELREEFGRFADEMRAHSEFMAKVELSKAMRAYKEAITPVRGELEQATDILRKLADASQQMNEQTDPAGNIVGDPAIYMRAKDAVATFRDELRSVADDMGLSVSQVNSLDVALGNLARANGIEEQRDAASEALAVLRGMTDEYGGHPEVVDKIATELEKVVEALTRAVISGEELEDPLKRSRDAAQALAELDMSRGISGAIGPARELESILRAAASFAVAIRGIGSAPPKQDPLTFGLGGGDPYGGTVGGDTILGFGDNPYERQPRGVVDLTSRFSTSGGGGGGGGKSEAEKLHNERLKEAERIITELRTETERYNDELADLTELYEMGYLNADQFAKAQANLKQEMMATQFDWVIDGIESISDAIADAIVNGESLGDALGNVFKQIAADLISSGIKQLLMQTFGFGGGGGGLFGGGGGGGGFLGSLFGGIFGGARASGGPVSQGRAYLVGEEGPELYVPGQTGSIIPNGAGSGGQNVNINVNVTGANGNTEVMEMVEAGVRAGLDKYDRYQLPQSVSAIQKDPRRRG